MEESENDDAVAASRKQQPADAKGDNSDPLSVSDASAPPDAAATRDSQRSGDATSFAPVSSSAARNPFDPRVSFRDPFPKFEDSMAGFRAASDDNDDDSGDDADTLLQQSGANRSASGAVNLDWSIDTIAELKPMDFSPLPEQKASSKGGGELDESATATTSSRAEFDRFFDDEAQYKVLRTPSPLIRQQAQQAQQSHFRYVQQSQRRQPHSASSPLTPGCPPPRAPMSPTVTQSSSSSQRLSGGGLSSRLSASPADLHRRCQDAIAFCEDRVRERERKLSRLQLPQPPSSVSSTAKRGSNKRFRAPGLREQHSEFPWKTSQLRTAELRGIHPRASTTPLGGERSGLSSSPLFAASPFSTSLTPIAPARQHHVMKTPERNPPKKPSGEGQRASEPEFSFDGGSPISPIAPMDQASARCKGHDGDDEDLEEKASSVPANNSSSSNSKSTPSSFESVSFLHSDDSEDQDPDKENNRRRQQPRFKAPADPTRSSSFSESPSFTLSSSWSKNAEDAFSLQTLARMQDQSAASLSSISFASSPGSDPDPGAGRTARDSRAEPARSQSVARGGGSSAASPSIAKRQESFMAAIEAEARAKESSSSPQPQPSKENAASKPSAGSIAELFQEARALGISEPRTQWEYVQLLKTQQQQRGEATR